MDTVDILHGRQSMPAVVTGKPLSVGGMKLHYGSDRHRRRAVHSPRLRASSA